MRIVKLQAENIKKLTAVEITPDGSVTQITGRNGSGKSSVLDAIFWALAGERAIEVEPVRRGERKALVRLDLGEVIVTRRFTAEGGTSLTVEAQNGARFPSPQRLLDELLGELTFDPLKFARMDAREQAETLRALVGIDTRTLDERAQVVFAKRTEVNRDVRSLTSRADAVEKEIDKGADTTLIDIDELLGAMETAGQVNAAIERERSERQTADASNARDREAVRAIEERIRELKRERDTIRERIVAHEVEASRRQPIASPVDTTHIRRQIEDARRANASREKQQQIRETHQRIVDQLQAARSEADNCTEELAMIAAQKREQITAARFPVDGLSLSDEGVVTYDGIPFEQASSAEQLRVSVALAMAANPKLRVLRVKDGSLLDERSLALIASMAGDNDYQVWVERVSESGKVGIYLEDGAVAAIDGERVQETERKEAVVE